jgi:electron transfer flavoprotein beta subunit
MANMRVIMPALQQAKPAPVGADDIEWTSVSLPSKTRETKVVENTPPAEIARELAAWIKEEGE